MTSRVLERSLGLKKTLRRFAASTATAAALAVGMAPAVQAAWSDEQVAHLYNPLHPAVLRLIEFSVQAATRANIPVSICGEMAADTRYTALLLGLGVRELSMAANAIPRVKQRIRTLDHRSAASRARMVMETNDTGRITMLLDDLNGVA